MEARVRFEKTLNGLSLMPAGSIDIKPDGIPLKSSVEMTEDLEESLPISRSV